MVVVIKLDNGMELVFWGKQEEMGGVVKDYVDKHPGCTREIFPDKETSSNSNDKPFEFTPSPIM